MAVAQHTLKHMISTVLRDCRAELEFLEAYRKEDDKDWQKVLAGRQSHHTMIAAKR